jgi:hypothetical protein
MESSLLEERIPTCAQRRYHGMRQSGTHQIIKLSIVGPCLLAANSELYIMTNTNPGIRKKTNAGYHALFTIVTIKTMNRLLIPSVEYISQISKLLVPRIEPIDVKARCATGFGQSSRQVRTWKTFVYRLA